MTIATRKQPRLTPDQFKAALAKLREKPDASDAMQVNVPCSTADCPLDFMDSKSLTEGDSIQCDKCSRLFLLREVTGFNPDGDECDSLLGVETPAVVS